MKSLKNIVLAVVAVMIFVVPTAFAEIGGYWVTGVTDLHVYGDVMFKDPAGYIYEHCSGRYAHIPEGHPGQKNMLALILMAKAVNKEIMCRIDRDISIDVSHCEVFYCKID